MTALVSPKAHGRWGRAVVRSAIRPVKVATAANNSSALMGLDTRRVEPAYIERARSSDRAAATRCLVRHFALCGLERTAVR